MSRTTCSSVKRAIFRSPSLAGVLDAVLQHDHLRRGRARLVVDRGEHLLYYYIIFYTVLYCIVLYYTILYYAMLYYHITLQLPFHTRCRCGLMALKTLHYITLHYIKHIDYITLHYITLHHIPIQSNPILPPMEYINANRKKRSISGGSSCSPYVRTRYNWNVPLRVHCRG